jgi:hypothetical protein
MNGYYSLGRLLMETVDLPPEWSSMTEKDKIRYQIESMKKMQKKASNPQVKKSRISAPVAIGMGLVASGGIFYWLKSTGRI